MVKLWISTVNHVTWDGPVTVCFDSRQAAEQFACSYEHADAPLYRGRYSDQAAVHISDLATNRFDSHKIKMCYYRSVEEFEDWERRLSGHE